MTQVRFRPGWPLSRLPLVLLCILAVMVLLTACGGGSGAGEAGPGASAPTQDQNQDGQSTSGQGSDGESSGSHPDGLFQTTLARNPRCLVSVHAGSTEQPPISVERLESTVVCFKGFDENGPQVHVELTGTQESADLNAGTDRADNSPAWFWDVGVPTFATPLGTYGIHATQDSSGSALEARGELAVVRATTPRVYALDRGPSAPGASFRVELAGFPPGGRAMVFLYYRALTESRYDFLRPLPPARIDAHGEARYSWTARPDDQAGRYAIWTNPTPRGCAAEPCASFEVRS
jgi:hypothetical protein